MAKKTAPQLRAELDEANDYIAQLESKLDDIAGIVTDDEEEEDEVDEDEEDDETGE